MAGPRHLRTSLVEGPASAIAALGVGGAAGIALEEEARVVSVDDGTIVVHAMRVGRVLVAVKLVVVRTGASPGDASGRIHGIVASRAREAGGRGGALRLQRFLLLSIRGFGILEDIDEVLALCTATARISVLRMIKIEHANL